MSANRLRPLTTRDLLRFQSADDPQISPSGEMVAWVRTWIDAEANAYRSAICITVVESGETRELPADMGTSYTHPRWSPDGNWLAYLAASDGLPSQLWVTPVRADGWIGSARALTRLRSGVQAPVWSPGGTRIAFTTRIDPGRGLESLDDAGADDDDPLRRFTRDVLVVDRMKWKYDTAGYFGNTRSAVALVRFSPDHPSLPQPQLVAAGDHDLYGPAWSSDGARLAVTGNISPEGDLVRRQFVYVLDMHASLPTEPREVFCLEDMRHSGLSWSPRGKQIAVAGHDDPNVGHYGNQLLWVVEVSTGDARCVTPGYDGTFGVAAGTDIGRYAGEAGVRWMPDRRHILALLSERGAVNLCSVDTTVDAAGRRAALLIRNAHTPGDIYVVDLDATPSVPRRITDVNAEILSEAEIALPEHFEVRTSDAHFIDAWLIAPVRRNPDGKVPLILFHGGGPGGMRGSNFTFEFQTLAAAGYAVLYCNARGCQGYGLDFCTAILGDWGGKDYDDNMECLDAALARFDFLDPERLGIAGGSYGGYHVNWAIGRTNRFRAAVSDRSVVNRLSTYGTSDIGPQREFEFGGGPPWETTTEYLKQSPLAYLGGAATPTLVIHSARDLRCPVEQGEQLYSALLRLGVPTELVRFPDESHELSRSGKPWHRVFRLDRYLDWFARYL
jgi:dipeptidyl aminopeptidase/acylaminoacyl peptidase